MTVIPLMKQTTAMLLRNLISCFSPHRDTDRSDDQRNDTENNTS
jgi:hypothetical protein